MVASARQIIKPKKFIHFIQIYKASCQRKGAIFLPAAVNSRQAAQPGLTVAGPRDRGGDKTEMSRAHQLFLRNTKFLNKFDLFYRSHHMRVLSSLGRLLAGASATFALTVSAAPLFGLYNTGVDNTGALLAAGSIDQHWTGPAAEYAMPGGYGPWTPPNTTSSWLSINPGGDAYVGYYDLATTFDLTGYDISSVSITGRCATDNIPFGIYVNGHAIANQSCSGFSGWNNFTLASDFISGINTLTFQYYNQSHQEGFRAEFINVSATSLNNPSIPEPASLALVFSALGALGLAARRHKSKAAE